MQKSVSLSSAEAEYFGAMMAARDVVFLRDLLVDLGIILSGASVISSDSKSAVALAYLSIPSPSSRRNTYFAPRNSFAT